MTRGRRWRWSRPPTGRCERAGRSQASGGIRSILELGGLSWGAAVGFLPLGLGRRLGRKEPHSPFQGLTEELGLRQVLKDEPGFQIEEEKERGSGKRNFQTDSSSRAGSVSKASAYSRHPTLT